MRILVTGAAGLIGRAVVERLLIRGHSVIGLDKELRYLPELLPVEARQESEWIAGSTRNPDVVGRAMKGCEAIIHLAAGASFLMYEEDPIDQTAGVIQGFHVVLEAAKKSSIGNIVFASTSAVYEHEGNQVPYDESAIIDPPDLKALAKKVNEEMAWQYSQRYGIRIIAMRPFSTYGESEMPKGGYANVISLFAWAMLTRNRPVVWGDGSQTRDFIFAEDVARAFALAVESEIPSQGLNVGTGVETSYSRVVELISAALDSDLEPVYAPVPVSIYAKRSLANMARTQQRLDFMAEISLDKGIERVLAKSAAAIGSKSWRDLGTAQLMASKRWQSR